MPTALNNITINKARKLRKEMTDGEVKLWNELREFRRLYGLHVRKQAPIGDYVADFAIHSERIIVEVDGEHHFTKEGISRDTKRDGWLGSRGYQVLRFTTADLDDAFDGCIEEILKTAGKFENAD